MFEEADSLGVSQGQGRGFAQVFDSTYNPVFKEETARLIEKDKAGKKEIDKDISGLDATVWKKAQPALQEKMKELYSYTMQNHRNITKGNTPEKLEYQKLISDIQLFTKEQKLQEDLWIKQFNNVALDKKGTYEPEALDILQKYFEDPNLNDPTLIANLPLSFNALEHTSKLKNIVKEISTKTSLNPGFKDLNDNVVYQKFVNTVDSKVEEEAKRLWNNLPNSGKQYYEDDVNNYIQSAKNFARESASQTVKTPFKPSQADVINQVPYEIKPNQQFDFSQKVGSGENVYGFTDDKTTSLYGTTFNVTEDAEFQPNFLKQKGGVLISLRGAFQAKKDDKGDYSLSDEGFNLGDKDNIFDRLFKDQGSSKFKANSIQNLPVFKEGTTVTFTDKKGKKRTVDLSNTVVSDDMLKKGEFRGLKLSDDNVSFEPIVVGDYQKEVKKGKQSNVSLGLPYKEFRGYMQSKNTPIKEMLRLEGQAESQDLLASYSYTEGLKRKGGEAEQPTQTKKAPDNTQKQTKKASDEVVSKTKEGERFLKRDEYIIQNYEDIELNAYDKYLKYSKEANTVASLKQMKDYSLDQIEEYEQYLDNPKRKGAPISIKQYFEGK
jgi:hypothetical protein